MSRRASLVLALALVVPGVWMIGCSEEDEDPRIPPTPTDQETIVRDITRVADPDQLTLAEETDSSLTYTVDGATPTVQAGDVWVDPTAPGILRRVDGVTAAPGLLSLKTSAATLVDAVIRATLRDTMHLELGDGLSPAKSAPLAHEVLYTAPGVTVTGTGLSFTDVTLMQGTYGTADVSVVLADGSFAFSPDLLCSFQMDAATIMGLSLYAEGDLGFQGDCELTASDAVTAAAEPTLLHAAQYTFQRNLGRVPVVATVTLEVYAGCELDLVSALSASFAESADGVVVAGVRYAAPSWRRLWGSELEAASTAWTLTGHPEGTARIQVAPVISVAFYGQTGAVIETTPFLRQDASNDGFTWRTCLLAGLGLDVEASGAGLDWDLPAFESAQAVLDSTVSDADSALVGGIIIASDPPGARILLDGANTSYTTPDTVTYIEQGPHEIRVYLPGYNEHVETVDWQSGFVTVTPFLSTPGWPRPVFTFSTPADSASYPDNVVEIIGTVHEEDAGGAPTPFTGNRAILTLNGVDQIVAVSGGSFSFDVGILTQWNSFSLRANGAAGQTGVSEPRYVFGDFVPDDIVIQLSWNTMSDMDLHVWNPLGEHCYFANKDISDGYLDIDNVVGLGPETFTATDAYSGTYVVRINSYALGGDGFADCSVSIWLEGAMPVHFGPCKLEVADGNGGDPAAWWSVTTFSLAGGLKGIEVEPLGGERLEQIRRDMENLPAKR